MRDIVINESPPPIGAGPGCSVSVVSQSIVHRFDELELGRDPVHAIRDAMRKAIEGITAMAAPATLRKREQARSSLASGARWAVERYGGAGGMKPPGTGGRLFNDSGRLAGGLEVRRRPLDRMWTIEAPGNRLDPSTFGNFAAVVERLRQLAPALADPLGEPAVRAAIARTVTDVLVRAGRVAGEPGAGTARAALGMLGL